MSSQFSTVVAWLREDRQGNGALDGQSAAMTVLANRRPAAQR